jgi:serine/threonine kinase PknH
MSQLVSRARVAAIAVLVGGYALTCPATVSADPNGDTLVQLLSKGYDTSNCKAGQVEADDKADGMLAGYECGQNSSSGGPTNGLYALYDSASDAAKGFQDAMSGLTKTPCAADDPNTWHYSDSPNTTAGKVACGTGNKGAMVAWTNDKNHLAAAVAGSDVKSLYKWWQADG